MRYTYRGLALLALACILYLEAFLFENLMPAFFALGIVLYMVYDKLAFSAQIRNQSLHISREVLESMLFAEKPFTVVTRVRNLGGPTRIDFEDFIPDGLTIRSGSNSDRVLLDTGQVAQLKYTVEAEKRGYYSFSEINFTTTGRAGLFTHESTKDQAVHVRIHSSRDELRKANTIAKREHLEVLGKSPERWSRTREFEFEGIREYVPGDRFRDIDWKSYSRIQKLATKIYEREAMVPTTILLDCGRSMRKAVGGVSKLEHGVRLSIQLSKILLSGYHPTGVLAFNELGGTANVSPDVARGQYDKILRALLKVPDEIRAREEQPVPQPSDHPQSDDVDGQRLVSVVSTFVASRDMKAARSRAGLEEVVKNSIAHGGKGQMFIIISDLESNHDSIVRSVSLARNRGHRVIVLSQFTELYGLGADKVDTEEIERIYGVYMTKLRTLARLRRLGVLVIELGPKDESAVVSRHVRRTTT